MSPAKDYRTGMFLLTHMQCTVDISKGITNG